MLEQPRHGLEAREMVVLQEALEDEPSAADHPIVHVAAVREEQRGQDLHVLGAAHFVERVPHG